MITVRRFTFQPIGECSYLVSAPDGTAVIVDPGCTLSKEEQALTEALDSNGLNAAGILLTHAHPDHMFAASSLQKKLGVPVYMSPADKQMLPYCGPLARAFGLGEPATDFSVKAVSDGETLLFGDMALKVIATPGHTPGSVCYLCAEDRILFTGDTLFAGSIGRTDLPLGDYDKLIVSIMDKLMALDGQTEILPGHGGPSTIGEERCENPFLEPFNEKEEIWGSGSE